MSVAPLIGKQAVSVAAADRRINVWEGSVRSGKTIASLLAWLLYVRQGPAGNLLMAGRTERTLERNIIHPLVEMLGRDRCRFVRGAGELWLLGRRVYIAGANDESSQERIRGLTLAGAYLDEASTVPESFWSMLLTRLSVDGARLYTTTNPDAPRHWLLRDYLDRAAITLDRSGDLLEHTDNDRLDLARFRFTLHDNPHLSSAYVAALSAEFVGLWYRRFVLGEWVAAEGAIYDMLDPTLGGHLVDTVPDIVDWWVAADYGTTNPFHAVLIGLGVDDRLYLRAEWRWDSRARRGQLTDGQYAERLTAWLGEVAADLDDDRIRTPCRWFIDPSAASFIRQLYRDDITGVTQADNTVDDGIRSTASLLAARRLLIHTDCTATIDELSGYSWDPKAQERGEDQPLKADDHAADAVRYGVMGLRRVWRAWTSRLQEQTPAPEAP